MHVIVAVHPDCMCPLPRTNMNVFFTPLTQLYEQKRKLMESAHKVELEALSKKIHKK